MSDVPLPAIAGLGSSEVERSFLRGFFDSPAQRLGSFYASLEPIDMVGETQEVSRPKESDIAHFGGLLHVGCFVSAKTVLHERNALFAQRESERRVRRSSAGLQGGTS